MVLARASDRELASKILNSAKAHPVPDDVERVGGDRKDLKRAFQSVRIRPAQLLVDLFN